jgi:hypothetical protein
MHGAGVYFSKLMCDAGGTARIYGGQTCAAIGIGLGGTMEFEDGTETIINYPISCSLIGDEFHTTTLKSIGAGVHYLRSFSATTVSADYLTIQNSYAYGSATWVGGLHSTDAGGNTGWIFPASHTMTINVGISLAATKLKTIFHSLMVLIGMAYSGEKRFNAVVEVGISLLSASSVQTQSFTQLAISVATTLLPNKIKGVASIISASLSTMGKAIKNGFKSFAGDIGLDSERGRRIFGAIDTSLALSAHKKQEWEMTLTTEILNLSPANTKSARKVNRVYVVTLVYLLKFISKYSTGGKIYQLPITIAVGVSVGVMSILKIYKNSKKESKVSGIR